MKRLMLIAVVGLVGCGGSSVQAVDPNGTWTVTDTLNTKFSSTDCPATAIETLTVAGDALQGYAAASGYCDENFCEMYGTASGGYRDMAVYRDHSMSGSRSNGWDPVHRIGCFYASVGVRAH